MTKYDKELQSGTPEHEEATKAKDVTPREHDSTPRRDYDDVPSEPKDSALRDE